MHAPASIPNSVQESIDLVAGKTYTISVTPSETISDKSILDLRPDQRDCRRPDENEGLRLFQRYTQSACVFECRLKHAGDKCQCIPWDYPAYNATLPLCRNKDLEETNTWRSFEDVWLDQCFEDAMGANSTVLKCNCPQECSRTQYTYSTTIQDTSTYQTCTAPWLDDFTLGSDPLIGDK